MNTPSHWLMTVAAGNWLRQARDWKIPRWALGLGSLAPDLPLYFLSFGGIAYYGYYLGWQGRDVARHLYQDLYYQDPFWIASHNFLHSPTNLLLLAIVTVLFERFVPKSRQVARWVYFFLSACLLHSLIDVVTHFDDGPVLFFPFDWSFRFSSPVSYWDPQHFGRQFMVFEAALDLFLTVYLVWQWLLRRKRTENS